MAKLFSARTILVSLALVSATAGCTIPATSAGGCIPGAAQGTSPAGLEQVSLCITSKDNKTRTFTVEVAATSQQQAQGLMHREALADDAGMIFPFQQPRTASFWMKNTIVSLDIIFVRKNGTIESIGAETTPFSTDPVMSGEAVAAVLELRGGLASELGIGPGDKVVWKQP